MTSIDDFAPIKDAIAYAEAVIDPEHWAWMANMVGKDKDLTPEMVGRELAKSGSKVSRECGAIQEKVAMFEKARPQLLTSLFARYVAGRLGLV